MKHIVSLTGTYLSPNKKYKIETFMGFAVFDSIEDDIISPLFETEEEAKAFSELEN